ncbi:Helix-turn-helix domain-containing protein [Amycolatopsis arida]|uniref:Helix-turn-helix domain-containing protein n=2 Tax=Amycolatopsis arida TaxID=587909 RepID=A0A1I5SHX9_9PSEU|nr:Helix-turn-helix domain-containing protein [Amycolatopsis arida]
MPANELARKLGWSPSKLSRVESGDRGVGPVDVALYASRLDASPKEIARLLQLAQQPDNLYQLRENQPDDVWPQGPIESLVVHESTADSIESYDPLLVPGLLETADYMREIFATGPLPENRIELYVQARIGRQDLLRRPNPPRLTFYIHEQVFRSIVGSTRLMHEQLLHVLLSTARSEFTVRVVPTTALPYGAFDGPFRLMEYEAYSPVAYAQSHAACLFLEDELHVGIYRKLLATLNKIAMSEPASREWIAKLASEYEGHRPDA